MTGTTDGLQRRSDIYTCVAIFTGGDPFDGGRPCISVSNGCRFVAPATSAEIVIATTERILGVVCGRRMHCTGTNIVLLNVYRRSRIRLSLFTRDGTTIRSGGGGARIATVVSTLGGGCKRGDRRRTTIFVTDRNVGSGRS